MTNYLIFKGKDKSAIWMKVDVCPSILKDAMAFTVQTKVAGDRTSKWDNAGKVQIISTSNWGRLSAKAQMDYMMNACTSM